MATARAPLAAVSETASTRPRRRTRRDASRVPICPCRVRRRTSPGSSVDAAATRPRSGTRGSRRRPPRRLPPPPRRGGCPTDPDMVLRGRASDRGRERRANAFKQVKKSKRRVKTGRRNRKTSRFVRAAGRVVKRNDARARRFLGGAERVRRLAARVESRASSRKPPRPRARLLRAPRRTRRRRGGDSVGTRRVVAKAADSGGGGGAVRGLAAPSPRLRDFPRPRALDVFHRRQRHVPRRRRHASRPRPMGCSASRSPRPPRLLGVTAKASARARRARDPGRRALWARASLEIPADDRRAGPPARRLTHRRASRDAARSNARESPVAETRGTCTSGTGDDSTVVWRCPAPSDFPAGARAYSPWFSRARDASRAELGPDVEWRLFWDRAGDGDSESNALYLECRRRERRGSLRARRRRGPAAVPRRRYQTRRDATRDPRDPRGARVFQLRVAPRAGREEAPSGRARRRPRGGARRRFSSRNVPG